VLKNSFGGISTTNFVCKLLKVRLPWTLKFTEITALVPFSTPTGDSAHELDWVGSDPSRFAGHWEPTQFNSLVPDAEKLNILPSTPKERV
jgi:hypothetical protein